TPDVSTRDEIEARIERVINGLLPEMKITSRDGPKATLKNRMAHFHTPGVSIAVINQGRIEWARGFGVKEQGKADPVTVATIFQAGSISKPIFAMAVMRSIPLKGYWTIHPSRGRRFSSELQRPFWINSSKSGTMTS